MSRIIQSSRPISNRKLDKQIRVLAGHLERNELAEFEHKVREIISPALITAARSQKVLTRGNISTRNAATKTLVRHAEEVLDANAASEFARYAALSTLISETHDRLKDVLHSKKAMMPRLSMRQLLEVAHRTFLRLIKTDNSILWDVDAEASVAENERRIHGPYGFSNDVLFALTRALNETASSVPDRDLKRPDAINKALKVFNEIVLIAAQICSLEYILDATSFGDLSVSEFDLINFSVKLDIVDIRLTLIRHLSIRRRIISVNFG